MQRKMALFIQNSGQNYFSSFGGNEKKFLCFLVLFGIMEKKTHTHTRFGESQKKRLFNYEWKFNQKTK